MPSLNLSDAPRNAAGRVYVPELDESPMARVQRLRAELEEPAAPPEQPATPVAVRPELPPETRWQLISAVLIILMMALLALYAFWPRAAERPTTDDRRPTTIAPSARPTLPPTAAALAPARAIVGYYDYHDEASATALTSANIRRVVGSAESGAWLLISTESGRAWVHAADVPDGTPRDDPLTDLTPPTPAAPAWEPPAAPEPTAAPAHEMPADRRPPPTNAPPPCPTWHPPLTKPDCVK